MNDKKLCEGMWTELWWVPVTAVKNIQFLLFKKKLCFLRTSFILP
jgi:hypothetical protein